MEPYARGHAGSGSHGTTGYGAECAVRCCQRYSDDDSQQVAYRPAAYVGCSDTELHSGVHSQVESTGPEGQTACQSGTGSVKIAALETVVRRSRLTRLLLLLGLRAHKRALWHSTLDLHTPM